MPKPGPVVCAEALLPVAFRSPAGRRLMPGAARPGLALPARRGRTARCGPVRPGPARPGRARPGRRRDRDGKDGLVDGRVHLVDEWPTGRVVLPTFGNKSRKTTKSYPSTGDQFWESRKTAKFDAPVGLLGRVSRTGSNYDSLEEAQWPCASFCQLSENRWKRQSPIRLRGISWGNENFCFNLFQQSSVPGRADRWVNGGSNKEPLI